MTIEIANETRGIVHVALYKRSPLRPAEPAVAWSIASPPPRGRAILSIPRDYRAFARYSFSPEKPGQPIYQTNALALRQGHDSLAIREISLGRSARGALLVRNTGEAGWGRLRIENHFAIGVWCHIQLGERDVHLPRLLSPHGVLSEALASPFFLAVVSPLARLGAPLAEHEIHATSIELEMGEDGAFTVHGSPSRGYRLTRGAPPRTERARRAQEAAQISSKRKLEKAPQAAEKQPKLRTKSQVSCKRREAAKEPTKNAAQKLTSRRKGRAKTKKTPSRLPPSSSGEPQASS
jgi:hypothetical protein